MVYKPVLRTYTGPDASKTLVEWLESDIRLIAKIPKKDIIFGKEEAERFNKVTKCWICKEFNDDDKKMLKLETTVILLVGIGELHTTHVILNMEYLILHLW